MSSRWTSSPVEKSGFWFLPLPSMLVWLKNPYLSGGLPVLGYALLVFKFSGANSPIPQIRHLNFNVFLLLFLEIDRLYQFYCNHNFSIPTLEEFKTLVILCKVHPNNMYSTCELRNKMSYVLVMYIIHYSAAVEMNLLRERKIL